MTRGAWKGLLLVVLVVALAAEITMLGRFAWPPGDLSAYWGSARLVLDGRDPFDDGALVDLQRTVGWTRETPNRLWYPPWALSLFLPFGALPFAWAQPLWLLAAVGGLLLAARALGRRAGISSGEALLLVVLGFPALAGLAWSQAGWLVLGGLTGVLSLRRTRPFLAGALGALAACKPHLTYLFLVGAFLGTARRARFLAGFVCAAAIGTGLVSLFVPGLPAAYLAHLRDRPPVDPMVPTVGTWLRIALGPERAWLQGVPAALGLAYLAVLVRRHWRGDVTDQALGWCLMVAVLTAPFCWTPDLIVLAPALVGAAAALTEADRRRFLFAHGALTVATAALHLVLLDHWFVWLPWALAGLIAWGRRSARRPDPAPAPTAPPPAPPPPAGTAA